MGTVMRTLLFSDIEGSTSLLERAGERYWSLLSLHRHIVRRAIASCGGTEHGTEGDSFFVSFETASAGVRAAVAVQHDLQREAWPDGLEVRVRIGLHIGEVVDHGVGLVGMAVHHAARIAATANGGQVVVSDEVRRLAQALDDGVEFISRGHFRLRDVGVVELHQVRGPGVDTPTTPLRANAVERTNVPRRMNPLVGRDRELQELSDLVRVSPVVTIVGTGGVGKTSLASVMAADHVDAFDGGAWLAELGALTDGDDVLAAVADAMSVAAQPGVDVLASIVDRVGSRRTLLLVDNCEHVLEASRQAVGRLVAGCPYLSVLATSREPLGVRGERIIRLGALDLDTDIVALFVDRATEADSAFSMTAEDRRTIIDIGRRLDGVPLAIELAAARVRSLSVHDISARLDDRFRLLRGGVGAHEDRHRTLRATVDWSFRMFGADERRVFERLSVFNGSIDLAAIEAVCDDGDLDDDVVDVMQSLVDRSMAVSDRRSVNTRYRLLETMREYAAERLAEDDGVDLWRHRHLDHFVRAAEDHDRRLVSATPEAADRWFGDHWDDLRGALRWSLEADRFDQADRLVVATAWFAYSHVRAEHLDWSELLWSLDGRSGRLSTAGCGVLAYWRGTMNNDETGSWVPAREGLARAADPAGRDTRLCWTCLPYTDEPVAGETFGPRYLGLRAVLAAMSDPADDWRIVIELDDAAGVSGDEAAMTSSIAAMRAVLTRVPSPELRFYAEWSAGRFAIVQEPSDVAEAARCFRAALDVARSMANPRLVGMSLRALAFAAVRAGSPEAFSLCVEAVDALYEIRYWQKLNQAFESSALVLARLGRLDDAATIVSYLERAVPNPFGMEIILGFRGETCRLIEERFGGWREVPTLGRDEVVALVVSTSDLSSI